MHRFVLVDVTLVSFFCHHEQREIQRADRSNMEDSRARPGIENANAQVAIPDSAVQGGAHEIGILLASPVTPLSSPTLEPLCSTSVTPFPEALPTSNFSESPALSSTSTRSARTPGSTVMSVIRALTQGRAREPAVEETKIPQQKKGEQKRNEEEAGKKCNQEEACTMRWDPEVSWRGGEQCGGCGSLRALTVITAITSAD